MKGVTSEVIAEVRSRAAILDVVSEHVVLKRAGKEHKGLCPFHAEKTPSFHVNPDKGIFKCFGCGEGGDVFAFVQKVKGLEFLDSVRELAHRFGVPLVESAEDQKEQDRRSQILMLYQQAAAFYSRLLASAGEGLAARRYLQDRGITEETVERFGLGYAPNAWDALCRYLTQVMRVSQSTLEEAGLVRRKAEASTCYDLFRNRLMIPIRDEQGRVIAFGGRTLGDSEVKYLNSPESPIYTKGQHLFAFNLAREAIKERDAVIVVEGYFDAIAAHQNGFPNTVATLGTALTERQAKLLVRYSESKRVYLSFDTDAAGERAMERGVEILGRVVQGIGVDLRVIRVPGGKDPDECLRAQPPEGGPAVFQSALDSAPGLTDYLLDRAIAGIDRGSRTGRIEAARRVVPILAQIRNSVEREEYIRHLAMELRLSDESVLRADVMDLRRERGQSLSPPRAASRKQSLKSAHVEAERQLIAFCLTSREDYERVFPVIQDASFEEPVYERIREALAGVGSSFNTVDDLLCRLQDRVVGDAEAQSALSDIAFKADELKRTASPVAVMLLHFRAARVKQRLVAGQRRLIDLRNAAGSDEEESVLAGRMQALMKLEKITLPNIKSESELDEIEAKIEEILGAVGRIQRLETTA